MRRYNPVAILVLILAIIVPLVLGSIATRRAEKMVQQYKDKESVLQEYNTANYYITGELYAVTPDGVQVIEDANGRLWEIADLHITRHNKLLLEVHNTNTVTHVWTEVWAETHN